MPQHYFGLTTRKFLPDKKGGRFSRDVDRVRFLIFGDDDRTLSADHIVEGENKQKVWFSRLLNSLDGGGTRDATYLIMYVHGYNTDFKRSIARQKKYQNKLAQFGLKNFQVIGFFWPSRGRVTSYIRDDLDARMSAIYFARSIFPLIVEQSTARCNISVSIVAHSMGALLVCEAFRAFEGMSLNRFSGPFVNQVIFMGADIDNEQFTRSGFPLLFQHTGRVTNYFNRADVVLATSNAKRFLRTPRLGRHGVLEKELTEVADIDCTNRWRIIDHANELPDFSDLPKSHTFYHDDYILLSDMAQTIEGNIDRRLISTRHPHPSEKNRLALRDRL